MPRRAPWLPAPLPQLAHARAPLAPRFACPLCKCFNSLLSPPRTRPPAPALARVYQCPFALRAPIGAARAPAITAAAARAPPAGGACAQAALSGSTDVIKGNLELTIQSPLAGRGASHRGGARPLGQETPYTRPPSRAAPRAARRAETRRRRRRGAGHAAAKTSRRAGAQEGGALRSAPRAAGALGAAGDAPKREKQAGMHAIKPPPRLSPRGGAERKGAAWMRRGQGIPCML